jgi:ABC-type multidrug transport system fused ATPase/permease subunit
MTRSISTWTVVDRILDLYRRNAGLLLPAAAVLYAVQFLIALILPLALALVVTILFWVLAILYQGFVVELVDADQRNLRRTPEQLVKAVTPVLGTLMAISILFALGLLIGFVLLIIPGLILMTFWAVTVPVAVLEHRGIMESFRRSQQLVSGNAWNVFGVILVVFLGAIVISFLVGLLAAGLGHVGRDLVQWAVNVAIAPVVALSATVLYFELRRAHADFGAPDPVTTA